MVVDSLDAAFLNEQRAMHAGGMGDVNTRSVTRITVVGQFADGVEFGVLNLGARYQFAVDFILATIVVTGRHAVPTEADDGVVLHDDAADFESFGIAAVGGDLRDLHVHRVVFFDVHSVFGFKQK